MNIKDNLKILLKIISLLLLLYKLFFLLLIDKPRQLIYRAFPASLSLGLRGLLLSNEFALT